MRTRSRSIMFKSATLAFLFLMVYVSSAAAQYIPASPKPADLGFLPGGSPSVNPIAGNLNLSFPLAKLAPSPETSLPKTDD